MSPSPAPSWLIFDGDCGYCQWSATRIGRRLPADGWQIVPQQRCPSPPMTPELRALAPWGVIVVTPDGRVRHAAKAVIYLWAQNPLTRPLAWLLGNPLVLPLTQIGYRFVARNRHHISRIFFKNASCALPPRPTDPRL